MQKIDPKPPKRNLRLATIAGLGPDPHWCGTHIIAIEIKIKTVMESDLDDNLVASDPLTALAHTINKEFKDNTDAIHKASSSQGKSISQEERYHHVVDKVNNKTFPTLAEFPTVKELHSCYSLIVNQLWAPHWTIYHFPLTTLLMGKKSLTRLNIDPRPFAGVLLNASPWTNTWMH